MFRSLCKEATTCCPPAAVFESVCDLISYCLLQLFACNVEERLSSLYRHLGKA